MREKIALAVLAAGRSQRFGTDDKLLAPLAGRPLCGHIASTGAGFDAALKLAVCPTGGSPAKVFAAHGFEIVENPRPETGLSGSLVLAVDSALAQGMDGLMICLADMPFVTLAHLEGLRSRWLASGRPRAIASQAVGVEGRPSPPAVFSAKVFPELLAMTGDSGAHRLIAGGDTVEVDAESLRDFDTPDDFRRAVD